jgi:hypothetical protein
MCVAVEDAAGGLFLLLRVLLFLLYNFGTFTK